MASEARIRQLPPSVVTKIAAGEVIERPASVVKELLENAVDAGSGRIEVEVEQGGAELIRVVDDGCGIVPDDLRLAFASHATSKLANADDLFRIQTLGFRGEALASIGGVAQVTLQSRPPECACGAEVTCHGGDLSPVRAWNGSPGTRIEVRHLFYNTPVRRKFLRTTGTEMGHIAEAFTRLALAQPNLHLVLRHNGKRVYEVPASAGLLDRLGLFFGAGVRDRLYAVDVRQGPARLHGYVADPACERGNAKAQYLFVNGRWVRDRSLGHALQEAYRGLLMTGRYAVVFLFLELPPDQVDVNVHPTKTEVRFRDGSALYHLVFGGVRDRLRAEDLTARLRVNSAPGEPTSSHPAGTPGWSLSAPPPPGPRLPFAAPASSVPSPDLSRLQDMALPAEDGPEADTHAAFNQASASRRDSPPEVGNLKAIQLYDAYLVLETPEGMLVIDQHALHERILFEQLKRRVRSGHLETQPLLIPEPVDLPAEQAARALEHRDALAELGLGIEDFGGGTLLLTSYPAMLGTRSPQAILRAVVDHLVSKERPPSREQFLNDLLSLMACHAAVRAGDRLTPEEMAALVAQRHLAEDTHHCPHGRPTSLLLSKHDLDRQFRRV
ncbi:MAG TPA: DNA mismatch repair endonuclease MutL [Gemmataceae bacterium]|nr:DNA mismatch repair endonuclease MutL [Gemmataceae bacterium]